MTDLLEPAPVPAAVGVPVEEVLRETESVCPVCLARIPARRVARGDDVWLRKACPEHGETETIVWRGAPSFRDWVRPKTAVAPARPFTAVDRGCPFDCGLCADHRQSSCCVLLEVTRRCDLACSFCFASAGGPGSGGDPTQARLLDRMRALFAAAGPVNLQLSGGEPCVRDDLPEIAATARAVGFRFVQVNTNGLRLARDPGYARRLADAGVATVFLQFDGTRDAIHERLRGRPLQAHKEAAIRAAGEAGLGVVLVPVIVPGVNDEELGAILRFAIEHQPVVRGIHVQPVSYFGRYPTPPTDADRITLPEVIAGLAAQSGGLVAIEDFQPAGAENALCSFNGTFVTMPDGRLHALTRNRPAAGGGCCSVPVGVDAAAASPAPGVVRLEPRRRPMPAMLPAEEAAPIASTGSACCGEPAVAAVEPAASSCCGEPAVAAVEPAASSCCGEPAVAAVDPAASSCCPEPAVAAVDPAASSCCPEPAPVEAAGSACCAEPAVAAVEPAASSCCAEPAPAGADPASPAVVKARDFVAGAWSRPAERAPSGGPSFGDWDVFLERSRTHTLAISGMAFQDAWTLDLDRLRDCHIHIADASGADIPFCAYNLTDLDGRGPYRPSLAPDRCG